MNVENHYKLLFTVMYKSIFLGKTRHINNIKQSILPYTSGTVDRVVVTVYFGR